MADVATQDLPGCSRRLLYVQKGQGNCQEAILSENIYYRPKCSCGKVMFSRASVILSTGRCLADTPPAHPLGRHPLDRHTQGRPPSR